MFFGIGAAAVIATIFVSFNNPRAIFWVTLGTAKVLICSLYDQIDLSGFKFWLPDALFISIIFTAFFCHLLEKYRIFEWELILYRLVSLSLIISAAKFFNVPVISTFYVPLIIALYAISFVLIFANSLCKAGLLHSKYTKRLNRFLKSIAANSKEVQKKQGWIQRWY